MHRGCHLKGGHEPVGSICIDWFPCALLKQEILCPQEAEDMTGGEGAQPVLVQTEQMPGCICHRDISQN